MRSRDVIDAGRVLDSVEAGRALNGATLNGDPFYPFRGVSYLRELLQGSELERSFKEAIADGIKRGVVKLPIVFEVSIKAGKHGKKRRKNKKRHGRK